MYVSVKKQTNAVVLGCVGNLGIARIGKYVIIVWVCVCIVFEVLCEHTTTCQMCAFDNGFIVDRYRDHVSICIWACYEIAANTVRIGIRISLCLALFNAVFLTCRKPAGIRTVNTHVQAKVAQKLHDSLIRQ